MKQIGSLFPLGGPVPPDLVIGREGVIADVEQRMREGLSTMLVGPRRIGKTTVCEAVCANLANDHIVVRVEVPERAEPRELLQLIIDRCATLSLIDDVKRAAGVVKPLIERLLGHENIPLDLSGLINAPASELPVREVLRLPLELARERRHRGVLFLDELQRVMGYDGGKELLQDLVDLYGGAKEVAVLVDGSEERTFDGMLGEPVHFGKLVDRLRLEDSIPRPVWREPLRNRFEQAGLVLPDEQLEALLTWGCEEPYRTMAASRYTALTARKIGSDTVAAFDVQMGCDEAERHLEDDGA